MYKVGDKVRLSAEAGVLITATLTERMGESVFWAVPVGSALVIRAHTEKSHTGTQWWDCWHIVGKVN